MTSVAANPEPIGTHTCARRLDGREQHLSTTMETWVEGYFASSNQWLLMVGGTAFAIWAALGLGRSISILPQARQLVTQGPYSIIRHPLYLGEMVATTGIALQYMAPWALLLLGLECMFQLLRIKNAERAMLEAFPEYAHHTARTARLVPGVY
jgi:protein-S-isoprenylcysteine O-methyltransferase Ste14